MQFDLFSKRHQGLAFLAKNLEHLEFEKWQIGKDQRDLDWELG
jgi:hypothetical protein